MVGILDMIWILLFAVSLGIIAGEIISDSSKKTVPTKWAKEHPPDKDEKKEEMR